MTAKKAELNQRACEPLCGRREPSSDRRRRRKKGARRVVPQHNEMSRHCTAKLNCLLQTDVVRVQHGEPNKDNSFDTKTVVLFLCLKRLNRAVCRLCACQGYACKLAFPNGELPNISIFVSFCIPLTRKQLLLLSGNKKEQPCDCSELRY